MPRGCGGCVKETTTLGALRRCVIGPKPDTTRPNCALLVATTEPPAVNSVGDGRAGDA